jgi:hypothetical protein
MLRQMVHESYSMCHCFIQEVKIALIRKAETHLLADTSLLLTFESTGSEWKKDLNHQVDSATSGNPTKENLY